MVYDMCIHCIQYFIIILLSSYYIIHGQIANIRRFEGHSEKGIAFSILGISVLSACFQVLLFCHIKLVHKVFTYESTSLTDLSNNSYSKNTDLSSNAFTHFSNKRNIITVSTP